MNNFLFLEKKVMNDLRFKMLVTIKVENMSLISCIDKQ